MLLCLSDACRRAGVLRCYREFVNLRALRHGGLLTGWLIACRANQCAVHSAAAATAATAAGIVRTAGGASLFALCVATRAWPQVRQQCEGLHKAH
jgi:hypothetical protein